MFICLDTSPELLSQPTLEKQVFAVDLISHLTVMCAMPKSLSYARLALNSLLTLLGVLSARERLLLVEPTLPAIARIARAFPPLLEDCITLLAQAASMHRNQSHLTQSISQTFDLIIRDSRNRDRIF